MIDTGFGSPSDLGAGDVGAPYDDGFGSPTDLGLGLLAAPYSAGFGTPTVVATPASIDLGAAYRDEGGELVTLQSDWPDAGPYRAELFDSAGTSWGYAYSPKPGDGVLLYPYADGALLTLALPPLPPGVYFARIGYGPALASTVDSATFAVKRSDRNRTAYTLRRLVFPASTHKAAGPRSAWAEPIKTGGA